METRQTWTQQVTARVRSAIKAAGKTEEFVGDQIGVPNATFSRRMNCHYPLTIADLEGIAEVIDVDPADFLPPRRRARAS
ncbi:helix-turn-helix transcriptional regulator [Nocardia sp. NPDC050712]|uniref:helix-turn-helix transcriptional regulator n=1 Tax=Nocardia sp. NPDC050712 TaxID=3155518 RepID=UPI0033E34D94